MYKYPCKMFSQVSFKQIVTLVPQIQLINITFSDVLSNIKATLYSIQPSACAHRL
jgi:hypothetical protein